MGNVISEEQDEEAFLKEGFNLESPDADKEINYGNSAPRCQPKHTESEKAVDQAAMDAAAMDAATMDETASDKATATEEQRQQAKQQKLSYIQMARMGYQELVNAIIRPPRADYKVSQATTIQQSNNHA